MLVMKEGKALYRRCRVGNCFYKIRNKAKKGKDQWNRGDLQLDLQTFWDCLNYWSHNKLSSEFFKKRETVQVFTSWCCPRRQRSLRLRSSPGFDPFSPAQEGAGRFCRSGRSSSTNQESWDSRRCSSSRRPWTSGWSWCCCHTYTGSADRPRHTCGRSCSRTRGQRRSRWDGRCSRRWMWRWAYLPTDVPETIRVSSPQVTILLLWNNFLKILSLFWGGGFRFLSLVAP